jgi:hypothetical protein
MEAVHETYDRTDLIHDLAERCLGIEAESAVLVCAHKVGKTHLLRHFKHNKQALTGHLFCWVDMDSLRAFAEKGDGVTDSTFLRFVLDDLYDQLSERVKAQEARAQDWGAPIQAATASMKEVTASIDSLVKKDGEISLLEVRSVFRKLQRAEIRLVLIIDEFQDLIREPRLSRNLFLFLRGANNNREIVSLVSSTVNLMDDSLHAGEGKGEDSRSLFNHFLFTSVAPFEDEEARGFLDFAEPKNLKLEEEEKSYLCSVGGGSPHFLKLAKAEFAKAHRPPAGGREAFERKLLAPACQAGFYALWRRCDETKRRLLDKIIRGGIPAESLALDELVADGYVQRKPTGPALFSTFFEEFVKRETTKGFFITKKKEQEKVRILFLAANPEDRVKLNLDEEARSIETALKEAGVGGKVELVTKWAVRPDDLLVHLLEQKPQIVHFSGHGSDKQELLLVGEDKVATPVTTKAIEFLFRALSENVRMVVFNACFSEPQAMAVTKHLGCAIGMRGEIGEAAARTYAVALYRALGFGESVERAHEQGIIALALHNITEELTPRLHLGRDVDPNEIRFLRA